MDKASTALLVALLVVMTALAVCSYRMSHCHTHRCYADPFGG